MSRPLLGAVDHVALSVTDLDRSEQFYTTVLGFVVVMVVPDGRICMHPDTALMLALVRHEKRRGGPFSELDTGVDHLGIAVSSRDDLVRWEHRLADHGVTYTPVRDELFGSHLNFRDPDAIALELTSGNELMATARAEFRSGHASTDDIAAFVAHHVGAEFAVS
ncbi:VOC family protein [Nocardioides aestuarii]